MKRIMMLIAVVAVVSVGLSFGMSRWLIRRGQPQMLMNIHDTTWLSHELSLSEAQRRDIEKLEGNFQAKLNASCAAHCAARFALGDELMKSKPDMEKARANVERMNQAQAEAEQATLEHILKVRALLTNEQARRYAAIIHDQVCNMPMGTP
ncbi:MAG: periplasmic heavy metal sensor [Verrucomicrobiia bacterium]